MRSPKDYLFLFLKGMGMGAADVVPGVSGGTIAFISGIYEELLRTIASVNLKALKVLTSEGLAAAWKHINGNFLVVLLLGIAVSVVSLAKLISQGLEDHPVYVWSFFFGLILASIPFMTKHMKAWTVPTYLAALFGAAVAFTITVLPAFDPNGAYWFIFLSGCIAICAMILPGISGSFILLLLGSYQIVLKAIDDKDLVTLGILAAGCGVGLLAFSRVLSWLFKNYNEITLSVLTGFLIGSLNKVWPWKETTKAVVIEGKTHVIAERNIAPVGDELLPALGIALAGFLTIFLLERLAVNKPKG